MTPRRHRLNAVRSLPPPAQLPLPPTSTDDSEGAVWRRLSLHEFLVDFLGGLVPGVLFTAASAAATLPALVAIGALLNHDVQPLNLALALTAMLDATSETPSAIWIALFVFGLMFAYVMGLSLYRRDPKVPDVESLKHLLREATRAKSNRERLRASNAVREPPLDASADGAAREPAAVPPLRVRIARSFRAFIVHLAWNRMITIEYRLSKPTESSLQDPDGLVPPSLRWRHFWIPARLQSVARDAWKRLGDLDERRNPQLRNVLLQNKEARSSFACCSPFECEFPYQHLSVYLEDRNHLHLAPYAKSWEVMRSKTHPNRIKIRLSYRQPEKYRPIVRNEAHVRLATSTWYMGQSLTKLALLCIYALLICATAVALASGERHPVDWPAAWIFSASMPALVVLAVARMSVRNSEAFVHYQRLREAFYLLELAYIAAHPHAGILEDPTPSSAPQ